MRLGDIEAARETTGRALAAMESTDDLDTHLAVLNSVWLATFESGDDGTSIGFAERALEVTRLLGNRHREAQLLSNLGLNCTALGRHDEAHALLDECVRLAEQLGHERFVGYGRQNLALVHLHEGRLAEAEQLARDSITAFGESDPFGTAGGELYLGMTLEHTGRTSEAAGCFTRARQAFIDIGSRGLAVESTAGLARCALAAGDRDSAVTLADEVWAHVQEHGRTGHDSITLVFLSCADVYAAAGDPERERAVVDDLPVVGQ
jgi:tetratricopeptide (TPR) repeat protein